MFHWELTKYTIQIINDTTLILSNRDIITKKDTISAKFNWTYHFIPTRTKPQSDVVNIKLKKWLWEDKQEWKNYKKRMKQRK